MCVVRLSVTQASAVQFVGGKKKTISQLELVKGEFASVTNFTMHEF